MNGPKKRAARLDQLLSHCGYCSRREAASWARHGRVLVDGLPVRDVGDRVEASRITVDGAPVDSPDGLLVMLHKPVGVVCSRDEREGPSIYGLLPERWSRRNPPVTSVGRLDKDTSGLLLVTDVGEWVHHWTSPRHHVEKLYEATLDREADTAWIELFAAGTLVLDGEEKPCLPAGLELVAPREVRLRLTEGRFHQVRRMFEAVGARVLRLHRPRFGPCELGDLAVGGWRFVEVKEVDGDGLPKSGGVP